MIVVDLHKMRPYWKPLGIVGTAVLLSIEPNQAFAAGYVPGTIRAKAEPIINLMKEAAEPISYFLFDDPQTLGVIRQGEDFTVLASRDSN